MAQVQFVEELIREYLIFRGFSSTIKAFDMELKVDKDKGFRVDKIVELLLQHVTSCDLIALRELWSHLDQKVFSKLEHHFVPAVRKLENAVLKFYLVNAVVTNKPEKVMEFFNKMTPDILSQPEWKEWFMLPFVRYPEENPIFAVHFTKHWQDTLLVSLHNFLATVFQCMPMPVLCAYEDETTRIRRLVDENEALKVKLAALTSESSRGGIATTDTAVPFASESSGTDLMDDFYVIAQEALSTSGENQSKTLKSLIRNIGTGLPTSPILVRRVSQQSQQQGHKKLSSSLTSEDHIHKKQAQKPRQTSAFTPGVNNRLSTSPASADATSVQGRRSELRVGSRGISDGQSSEASEKKIEYNVNNSTGAGDIVCTGPASNFLLLSQEQYAEHRASITQCRFNSAGSAIASCDNDGVVKLWTLTPTPKTSATFVSKSNAMSLAWVTKNERYFLTGHKNGSVKLYDTQDNKMVWEIATDITVSQAQTCVMDLCCSPNETNFVCCLVDGQQVNLSKLLLFDLKTKKLENYYTFGSGHHYAKCCAFNHNGQLLFTGCSDGAVRIFDIRSSDCIDVWHFQKEPVEAIQLVADYTACFTLSRDCKLRRHCLSQRGQILSEYHLPEVGALHTLPEAHGQFFSLDTAGKNVLLCGNMGGIIAHVGTSNINKLLDMGGHCDHVVAVDWAIANQCVTCVTASADGKIQLSTLLTP